MTLFYATLLPGLLLLVLGLPLLLNHRGFVGALQRMLGTVQLTGDQWRPCLIAVGGYLVLSELGQVVVRLVGHGRRGTAVAAAAG